MDIAKEVKEFSLSVLRNLAEAHDAIIEARTFQTERANRHRCQEPAITMGNLVYLSTKNLNMPKDWVQKLCLEYIGPYKVTKMRPETSTYTLELPTALQKRRILPTFHIALLRPHQASTDVALLDRTQPEPYDFGAPDEQEWFVNEILGHQWVGKKQVEYQVHWRLGDMTWESHANCNKLAALDRYFELQRAKNYMILSHRDV